MELVRHDGYAWGSPAYDNTGAPWVDRIVFRTLPEDAARAAELESGGIDLDIDVSPQHMARLEGRGVKVTSIPRLSSNHIGFNVEKDVFKDVRVRRAVAHAVNRQEIVQFVMKGQADVSHGFLHPLVPGREHEGADAPVHGGLRPRQVEAAPDRGGLDAGRGRHAPEGRQAAPATLYVFTELHERIVTPVQAQLRQVGFDLQLKRLESAAFTTATRAGEHDARFLPMIYSSGDFLYFFVSAAIPSPNTTRWRDDRTDTLFQQSQTSLKEAERVKAFQGIEQRLVGEAVVVPIQHVRWIFGSRPRAHGLKYHPIHGIYKLMDVVGRFSSPRTESRTAPRRVACGHGRKVCRRIAIRAGYVIAFDGAGPSAPARRRRGRSRATRILSRRARASTGGWTRRWTRRTASSRPGLISTHAHISGSPLDRSFIEDRGNPQFWYSGLFEMLPVRSEAQDEEAGRACVDFSMAELLRGGVTTVMEIGTLGEYVVERAPHYGLRVYMGQAFRSGRWLTRDGKRVEWEWNEEQGRAGPQRARSTFHKRHDGAHGDLVRCFVVAVADRHLHARAAAGRQALRRRGRAARTRCTPRSPWSSSTRWWPATARRPSPG